MITMMEDLLAGRLQVTSLSFTSLSLLFFFSPFAYMSHLSLLCQCIIIITARAFDNPYNIYCSCTFVSV